MTNLNVLIRRRRGLARNEIIELRVSGFRVEGRMETRASCGDLLRLPRLCPLSCAHGQQRGSPQQGQSSDDRWERDVLRRVARGVNWAHVENFYLARITESLVNEGDYAQNDEQNSKYGS